VLEEGLAAGEGDTSARLFVEDGVLFDFGNELVHGDPPPDELEGVVETGIGEPGVDSTVAERPVDDDASVDLGYGPLSRQSLVHREECGISLRPFSILSALWNHRQWRGQPLKNMVVRMPGPLWTANRLISNMIPFKGFASLDCNISHIRV